MKSLFRLIGHLIVLCIGVFLGILWGARNPDQAANVNQQEEIAASKAKIEFLEKFSNSIPNGSQMLADEKAKLNTEEGAPATQP